MAYTDNAITTAGIKMDAFGETDGSLFKNTKANGYFVELKALVAEAREFGSLRQSAGSAKESSTGHKGVLKRSVIANMRSIARAARLKAEEEPDFVNELIVPATNLNYQRTIEAALAFIEKGAPLEIQLKEYGLLDGTFAELTEDTADLEQANRQQGSAATTTVGANARLDNALKGILDLRRKIGDIAKNLLADNPQKLAEWMTASHLEKSPKRPVTPLIVNK